MRLTRLLAALAVAVPAAAAPVRYGTESEAHALLNKAVALFQKQGPSAIAEIGKPDGAFRKGDLYVFVIGPDRKIAADPFEASLVGADVATLRDPHGKPYALLIDKQATEDGTSIEYEATNPQTGRVEDKSALAVRSGAYVFACGYYLPPPKAARTETTEAAETKVAGAGSWAGRWSASDEDGSHFTIELDPAGNAASTRGEGQRGFWIFEQDHVRIDWSDGWTDYLVPSDAGFQKMSFAPGAARDEKPSSTTAIEREKSEKPSGSG